MTTFQPGLYHIRDSKKRWQQYASKFADATFFHENIEFTELVK